MIVVLFVAAVAFLFLVDTAPLTRGQYLRTYARLTVFKYTGLMEPGEWETAVLYRWSCTGLCHGAEPIETSRHTAKEWDEIIDRMIRRNGAFINEREARVISSYLLKNFASNVPTILSPSANKFLKSYLWKSDFGENDLYVDVVYTPPGYDEILRGFIDAERYDLKGKLVFRVYFNTHQGKLDPFDLMKMAELRDSEGRGYRPLDWKVTYESGDKHHREGILRFERAPMGESMELVMRGLPGRRERVFYWKLPIPPFEKGDKR
ncbi:MAG TPA: hypothetical protein ENJ37_08600 [Deltaproteobacteria bacterium]|nr:hypothetical protein [Deltaproteobacteria bacterium]